MRALDFNFVFFTRQVSLERPFNDKISKERVVGPVYHPACDLCDASCTAETF